MQKRIGIASDHAGVEMKAFLKNWLESEGYEIYDFGTHSTESMDYPDVAHPLANAVSNGEIKTAIALCGSGIGISITLNRHCGVRAALCWMPEIAQLSRQHNNANICALPARYVNNETAQKIVATFLATAFEGGRHERRIEKIEISN